MAKKAGDFAPKTGWVHSGQDADGRDMYRIPFQRTVLGKLEPWGDSYPISLPTALDVKEFGDTSLGAMWAAQHKVQMATVVAKNFSGTRVFAQEQSKELLTTNRPEKAAKAMDTLSDDEYMAERKRQDEARGIAAA